MHAVKFVILLYISTLSFSCKKDVEEIKEPAIANATSQLTEGSTALFTPLPATKQDFLNAKNVFTDDLDTTAIPKLNGKITLPLKGTRPAVIFKDSISEEDETAVIEYHYLGRNNNPALYQVEGSFWEWNECYLVNQYTGRKDTLWTIPVFSPDKSRIVNLSEGYGMEGNPNGYQLWQISGTKDSTTIRKTKEVNQDEWIPAGIYWENNHTLIFKAVTVTKFMARNGEPKEADFYYFRVKVSK
ncbi:hypothetical protein ACLI09_08790 [Flavobacterium sp. RHBU_24]|uniref:hypothetical protein n=1 Tax=Flavobacterium sp. RHBU_24 TaxID=3391185 RepID=UPI0039852497